MAAKIEIYAKPTWLYRFRSLGMRKLRGEERLDPELLEREISAIEENYIYCSTYQAMNDPMEGLYLATLPDGLSTDYDGFVEQMKNNKLGLGIASLGEAWDNELMWAHYANGFRGICVGYGVAELMGGLTRGNALTRVAYGDRPYSLHLSEIWNQAEIGRAILSTKNLRWLYEREWRLFAQRPGPARHGPDVVDHVYLGARFPDADRRRVTERLLNAGIEVRSTRVDGYRVERVEPDAT